jgi:NADH-quinone oxidoreductase subunit J
MDAVTLLIALAGVFAIASSIGVLLTKDNLYAALYMSVSMLMVAAIYAVYNLQPVIVMIAFVFVGAVGMITIAIAATYRFVPVRRVDLLWIAPILVVFAVVAYAYYSFSTSSIVISDVNSAFATVPSDYLLVVIFLFSVMVLMMLSAIKLVRRVET